MASFKRSLSLVPQHGSSANEEEYTLPSSLSKSSSFNLDHQPTGGLFPRSFSSLDYASSKIQSFVLGFFTKRSSRSLERLKSKGNSWRRALLHFFVCFLIGIFIGLTPFASPTFSVNLLAKHPVFSLEMLHQVDKIRFYHDMPKNVTSIVERVAINNNAASKPEDNDHELKDEIRVSDHLSDQSLYEEKSISFNKLLIIVTPISARPFQAYYLNRLAQTLRLVPPPLLWIVVEMRSQSIETAELLRNAAVMYRHLICKEILTDTKDRGMHLRNVALSHIEEHQLDGIIYFADDDNIYTLDLFDQLRQIRRFGTWTVANLLEKNMNVIMEGPICNGSQVIGWHRNDITNKSKRFHIGVSGFAFNSTILWDPKRLNTLQPIRLAHTVKGGFQVGMLMEHIVEDEKQIEGFPLDCSRIMVWHLGVESLYSFPHENSTKTRLTPYWLNGV